ncbi:3-deoxy-manno-octulosonate cytidylyltransferase [Desulfovibrio psychrotolerans]|uniref:3-deoxy-manno-octulosonate cytidylyltransferase n=1 Tax=Desulfovibrio psychrotolerans TaxID=415242 RepID=A0A7J0BY26_9BACT|nr:3-deoxy-manno-octulosonate cytidylyltransferase [Desulfovibrio psychrotolerans]GFM38608.1 3-deoxy-manno-octulosonate cytidylyltransferase [Desulfovibrio psychrotolerans]
MASATPVFGIIPARYESSRFPGKPLADILGKPMFWHVYTRARQCPLLTRVVLATDDLRIADAAREHGVECVMTRTDHPSGTDRVYEAACLLGVPEDAVVVNIQGDEPALNPQMLTQLVSPFTQDAAVQVSTLAQSVSVQGAHSPDVVKVVCSANGDALYFSRAPIPFCRDADAEGQAAGAYHGHIGLYAFRLAALRRFTELAPSRLEQTEKLEQLRLLENNISIRVVMTQHKTHGVDRPEDIATILNMLRETP